MPVHFTQALPYHGWQPSPSFVNVSSLSWLCLSDQAADKP